MKALPDLVQENPTGRELVISETHGARHPAFGTSSSGLVNRDIAPSFRATSSRPTARLRETLTLGQLGRDSSPGTCRISGAILIGAGRRGEADIDISVDTLQP
jgi:hypothetical protein